MSHTRPRHVGSLFRLGTLGIGGILLASGALGLYNLAGTGGGIWLRVIQSYCVLAAGSGGVFVYGSLLQPAALNRILVITFRVGALLVVIPSALALWGGSTGGGELAPFFVILGLLGSGLALVLGLLSTRLDSSPATEN